MFTVKENNGIKGLYLDDNSGVQKGKRVMILEGPLKVAPTQTSIKVKDDLHIEDHRGQYINHACQPSTRIDGINVIALQDLSPGDQITFNYQDNEDDLVAPFDCICCGNRIS